jgi:hypothetical protein
MESRQKKQPLGRKRAAPAPKPRKERKATSTGKAYAEAFHDKTIFPFEKSTGADSEPGTSAR